MIGGKLPRYVKLLRLARGQHDRSPQKIETAIQEKDYKTAQRLAHSLKSVGANIGAMQLSLLAFSIEQQIRETPKNADISLQDVLHLQVEWQDVKDAIDQFIIDNQ